MRLRWQEHHMPTKPPHIEAIQINAILSAILPTAFQVRKLYVMSLYILSKFPLATPSSTRAKPRHVQK